MLFIPKDLDQNILTITELLYYRRLFKYSGNVAYLFHFSHSQRNTEDKEATIIKI